MPPETRMRIGEVIVVEGRDDTCAVLRAVDAMTIETHGYGIRPETWALLEKAYREKGLIVFTDPDHAGEAIRKRILARFPHSKQAFLTRHQATQKGDTGIENAAPADILRALQHARCTAVPAPEPVAGTSAGSDGAGTTGAKQPAYTREDLLAAGLLGQAGAEELRQQVGAALGIGYGNGKAFLQKLNGFAVPREDFMAALSQAQQAQKQGQKGEEYR